MEQYFNRKNKTMNRENCNTQGQGNKGTNQTNMAKGMNTCAQIKRNEELKEKREK